MPKATKSFKSAAPTKAPAKTPQKKSILTPKNKTEGTTGKKIYVLDTSVLLHDHNCINSFEEHLVAIPITVLEELDKLEKHYKDSLKLLNLYNSKQQPKNKK
jgi:PhoH-like ATPase